ncbi:site-specific DNA-methyltransferase, partial [Campylobacter coli]|uniref:site-specific DNA-methyltransferase n=1 Tax=Campylobacter coli TaxID=195 RepID=UPI000A797042
IYNCMDWQKDEGIPKVHPTQKPVKLLERLITIFTDAGDVVIDPCAGSGSTLLAATNLNRKAYGLSLIHISEPTRLLSISYAVFCLKKKN